MHEDRGPDTPRVAQPEEDSVRHAWERQDGESERAWSAFKAYRNMAPRVLHRTEQYLDNVKVASGEISKWFTQWRWQERCISYDVLTDRIIEAQRRKFLEESVEDISADQLAALGRLRRILNLELGKYLQAAEAGNGPGLIKPSDLKGLLEAEIKLTRLVKGETTEEVGVQTTPGLDKLDPDVLMEWRAKLKGLANKDKPDTN